VPCPDVTGTSSSHHIRATIASVMLPKEHTSARNAAAFRDLASGSLATIHGLGRNKCIASLATNPDLVFEILDHVSVGLFP
jgi:hypothetical protein